MAGEMSNSEIEVGGEWYETRIFLEDIARLLHTDSCKVHPFDQYQGPYCLALRGNESIKIWKGEADLLRVEFGDGATYECRRSNLWGIDESRFDGIWAGDFQSILSDVDRDKNYVELGSLIKKTMALWFAIDAFAEANQAQPEKLKADLLRLKKISDEMVSQMSVVADYFDA